MAHLMNEVIDVVSSLIGKNIIANIIAVWKENHVVSILEVPTMILSYPDVAL